MHELIDLAKFELAIRILAGAALPAGLVVGAWLGRVRGQMHWYLTRGGAVGLLGPILYALWCYYRWTVRLDPGSGYVGLHKPSVLFLNVVVFVVLGSAIGLAYGRILRRSSESSDRR